MEWIKVEDELPEEMSRCMFVVNSHDKSYHGKVYGGVYTGEHLSKYGKYNFSCPGITFAASHWQYSPEPPHQQKLTWQYELKSEPGVWKDATDDEYESGCDLIRMNWRQVEK